MKNAKKIVTMAMALTLAATAFSACEKKELSDYEYIQDKGELVIGITYFAPMNYKDDAGELIGFETEFAKAVCEKLDIEANFQEIDWNSKEIELNAKNIDCIWNGMTIDAERKENMDISVPYMENKQVLITTADKVAEMATKEGVAGKKIVAEAGSAGDTVVTENEFFAEASYTSVDSQAKSLLEVKSGVADATVIDYVMSIGSIGEGTDYADLAVVEEASFNNEEYGIAFRKDSPETLEAVNGAIQELAADGTLNEIAAKYKLENLILVK